MDQGYRSVKCTGRSRNTLKRSRPIDRLNRGCRKSPTLKESASIYAAWDKILNSHASKQDAAFTAVIQRSYNWISSAGFLQTQNTVPNDFHDARHYPPHAFCGLHALLLLRPQPLVQYRHLHAQTHRCADCLRLRAAVGEQPSCAEEHAQETRQELGTGRQARCVARGRETMRAVDTAGEAPSPARVLD